MPFCKVLDFMPYYELGEFYRSADVGVWPTNESISMLDAAACGLPLIVSDGIGYFDHVIGNGLVYHMNDLNSLIEKLYELKDLKYRMELGVFGSTKIKSHFSWDLIAKRRLNDYELSLRK
jgi:glycosyltransferase involved in cell wall biosynthesis